MIVVDSSGWLEYFTDGPLADKYYPHLKKPEKILVPAVVLYEVYKKVAQEKGEEIALQIAAQMGKSEVVPIDHSIVLLAADVSIRYHLPMADAMVYATALSRKAHVVTSDNHFESLPDVIYYKKNHA